MEHRTSLLALRTLLPLHASSWADLIKDLSPHRAKPFLMTCTVSFLLPEDWHTTANVPMSSQNCIGTFSILSAHRYPKLLYLVFICQLSQKKKLFIKKTPYVLPWICSSVSKLSFLPYSIWSMLWSLHFDLYQISLTSEWQFCLCFAIRKLPCHALTPCSTPAFQQNDQWQGTEWKNLICLKVSVSLLFLWRIQCATPTKLKWMGWKQSIFNQFPAYKLKRSRTWSGSW